MAIDENLHRIGVERRLFRLVFYKFVLAYSFETFCKVMGAAQTGLFSFGSSRSPGAVETVGRSREGDRLGSAVSFSEVPPMSLAQSSEAQSRLVANEMNRNE